ncbi:UDP-4-amino-4,6-dideoxy-N-acetyl-beta-L-altrosamine transaminase [Altererythrobacter soli]|uniref:UDP-4-amino-4, 6-dideoxy-N-acetyl-beta-L-altrosamine transaminase n=1 Tax=Croceibacterium soli TaxID=1739690 RepID=A0A6I4UN85_9SPHN|nr:DegT/DnrJ/EryC1/StrS family aminotransferase [Croceibacterium soli]MXP40262.1 UDP-4-amino-4,6-dideoxy-N-acetyl-beta-L-altrosamine transaminase [Croceibacterium soli]
MPVPYFRLKLEEAEIEAVVGVLRSGWLTSGAECAALEREFAEALGGGVHAIAVNSNTSGMHLALEAAGVGPGDEVIVPDLTFTATAEVVRYLGAEVVFADVLPDTLCIDPGCVRRLLTHRTKAILPVHFGGLGAEIGALQAIASEYNIVIIEDAAHSFPASAAGSAIGKHGSFATVFSFYANKTITTGEGGMIVTSDEAVAQRCRVMRLHGIDRDAFRRFQGDSSTWNYDIIAPGFKYNLPDIAAALGRRQLARAEAMRERRAAIAARYHEKLSSLPLELPPGAPAGDKHAWHLYPVRLTADTPTKRSDLEAALAAAQIGYSVHYTPLHRMSYWRERYGLSDDRFPVATDYFRRCLSLPIFSDMRIDEADEVVSVIRDLLG